MIICIVSLSSSGLQQLLNICSDYCELHELTYNNFARTNIYEK